MALRNVALRDMALNDVAPDCAAPDDIRHEEVATHVRRSPDSPVTFRDRHPLIVQLARYATIGGLSTGVNALIFLILRQWLDAVPANLVALVLSTAVSTEANRRFTFGGAAMHAWRAHVQNGGTVLFYAFYSSAVLLLLGLVVDEPSPLLESATVAVASLLGGCGRFLILRYWVIRPVRSEGSQDT